MLNREKLVLFFYTFFNIISNQFLGLYSDEAYYWLWSKKLSLSYFDHPGMVAYLINITTFFSDDPLFVRLSSALLVSATAVLLYKLATRIFDQKAGIYTFYIFLSSFIILGASTLVTPDIALMFFWTLMLYSSYIYLEDDNKKYAIIAGLAAGAMLVSKYTGVLPLVTLLAYIIMYKRYVFKDVYFYIIIGLMFLVVSPVLYWNYEHEFISFLFQIQHGMQNEEKVFLAKEFFNFIGVQFVLFHPLYLAPLFYFIVMDKQRFEQKKVFLLLPFLFVVVFFSYNAAFKEANAQWAAGGYLSASVLLGYYFSQHNMKKLMVVAVSLSAFIMITLKTPLGDYLPPIKKMHQRLGHIDKFEKEISELNLNINDYDYLLIDDYHGSEVPYYFRRHENILVLNNARFSHFNIWRHDELGIGLYSPLTSIPSLGKCIYIGRNKRNVEEIAKLFGNQKELAYFEKVVGDKDLKYYFVEYQN